jgi:hypothetical protein
MRKKMPPRPYYGELEVGETFPGQSKKKAKKAVKKTNVKKASMGSKVAGTAKSAIQKRKEAHRKILESMD